MRALVIAQHDDRRLRQARPLRVGDAWTIERVAGVENDIAEGDRPARPPRPMLEHQREIAATPARLRTERYRHQSKQDADQAVRQRPDGADALRQSPQAYAKNAFTIRHERWPAAGWIVDTFQRERRTSQVWIVSGTSCCAR